MINRTALANWQGDLQNHSSLPGIHHDDFQKIAREAKENCPVSKALAGCDILLEATLKS